MTRSLPGLLAISSSLERGAVRGAGCDDKKNTESRASRPTRGASTDKYATADPKLEKALQAAAASASANENGPPPDGIFAPGAADRRHPKGAPTTVDMVGDGDEPPRQRSPATRRRDAHVLRPRGDGAQHVSRPADGRAHGRHGHAARARRRRTTAARTGWSGREEGDARERAGRRAPARDRQGGRARSRGRRCESSSRPTASRAICSRSSASRP